MRHTRCVILISALVLAACKVVTPVADTVEPLVRKSAKPVVKASASIAPVESSAAPATPASSASPSAPPAVLLKPAGAVRAVSGLISIDAHYGVTRGGGRVLSNNGGNVLTFGAASVIGNNGGNIISDNGASLIGKVKAPVVGLVSKVGGYRVLQTGDAPALGEVLPAAGMAIRAFSLRTGNILSLGVDAAGKPVFEVYSGVGGGYQIFLPEAEVNNVLLQAFVPESTDERLNYNVLVSKQEAEPTFDEDTALVADFLRRAFTDNMDADLAIFAESATLEEAVTKNIESYSASYRELLMNMRRKLFTAAEKAGVKGYDAARRHVLAQRITDAALSHMDLPAIRTDYAGKGLTLPEEAALPALATLLRIDRERIRTHMRQLVAEGKDVETEYSNATVVKRVNEFVDPPFVIRTPADAITFYVRGLVNNPQMPVTETRKLLRELQDDPQYQSPPGQLERMYGCTVPLERSYIQTFYLDEAAGKDAVAAIEAGVEAP